MMISHGTPTKSRHCQYTSKEDICAIGIQRFGFKACNTPGWARRLAMTLGGARVRRVALFGTVVTRASVRLDSRARAGAEIKPPLSRIALQVSLPSSLTAISLHLTLTYALSSFPQGFVTRSLTFGDQITGDNEPTTRPITSLVVLGYRRLSTQARVVRVFHGQATVLLYKLEENR